MSPTYRRARMAVVSALGLSLLTACPFPQDPANAPAPNVSDYVGNGPNCPRGYAETKYSEPERYDINADRTPDLFYVYRCEGDPSGDNQVEVYNGKDAPKLKHLDGKTPYLLYIGRRIHVGCLMFTGATVFIIGRKAGETDWTLQGTASWNGKGFKMTAEAGKLPMPCTKRVGFPPR